MRAWIARPEALKTLGVRPQTLYAYVSRGRIGMKPDPDDPRRSLYRADDISALVARRSRGKRPAAIAASAIAWGEPVITTGISTILRGALIYRGQNAAVLADHSTLEDVAALLWQSAEPIHFATTAGARARRDPFVALSGMIAASEPTLGRGVERLRADAATVVGGLAAAFGVAAGPAPLHRRLGKAWSLNAKGTDLLRRALVLLADHELNASTFAVRVAASTGASIAASLMAGLATLSGPHHGGAGAALLGLIEDAARSDPATAVRRWLDRGQGLPGFGHPLYPAGDPRATVMLEHLKPDPLLAKLRDSVAKIANRLPNIDFALAALTRTHDLPPQTPFQLFAMGRSVGWSAHAIEQATTGQLIRPRARYEGDLPAD